MRSTINDLQRNNSLLIPNDLYDLLIKDNGFHIANTTKIIANSEVLESYIQFLLDNQLAFICHEGLKANFPLMDTTYYDPFVITNMIVDIELDLQPVLKFLDNIALKVIPTMQLRFLNSEIDLSAVTMILEKLETVEVHSLHLIVAENLFHNDISIYYLNKFTKLDVLYLYGSKEKRKLHKTNFTVFFVSKAAISHLHCGLVNSEQFAINIPHYTESLKYNTCLNKKISIDVDGNIKNCPSMSKSFGNIKDTTIEMALNTDGFKSYWNINKDEIKVCQDCEFRQICSDCRAFVENPNDDYSKPLKCGYSPYTNEWEEWSTNPLKAKAIEFYRLNEILENYQYDQEIKINTNTFH
jgi:SPASM domain peptide maturase of grasp-with-spasm system